MNSVPRDESRSAADPSFASSVQDGRVSSRMLELLALGVCRSGVGHDRSPDGSPAHPLAPYTRRPNALRALRDNSSPSRRPRRGARLSDIYGDDLARVHHAGFSSDASRAAPHLLRVLKKHGVARGRVVDLGCGTGAWCRALCRAGYDAIGVDGSASMIARARALTPRAAWTRGSAPSFVRASIDDVELEPCRAITALGEVFSYLSPARRRRSRGTILTTLFRRIARALEPGGVLVFDVLVHGSTPMSYRTWRTGPDWAVLVDVREDRRRSLVRREITTFVRAGASYRRRSETHVLRVYRDRGLIRALERAGFTVSTARSYGCVRLAERRLAFVARRLAVRSARARRVHRDVAGAPKRARARGVLARRDAARSSLRGVR
jgi:SAM-dependent methyltransferase